MCRCVVIAAILDTKLKLFQSSVTSYTTANLGNIENKIEYNDPTADTAIFSVNQAGVNKNFFLVFVKNTFLTLS